MSRIRGKNTKPEIAVRQALHALGFRFRLHDRKLPGTPDIVLPRYRTVVLVHGCFWHQHAGCKDAVMPKSNTAFWDAKLAANLERDERDVGRLKAAGWNVLVVWECEVSNSEALRARLSGIRTGG